MTELRNRTHFQIIRYLIMFSFLGWVISLIINLIIPGEGTSIMTGLFTFFLVISVVILIPVQVLQVLFFTWEARKEGRELEKLTVFDVIGLPLGGFRNIHDKIPEWITIPVLAVLYLLVVIFVLLLLVLFIRYHVYKLAGS